ncbi:MAG: hypothetical protein AABY18_09645 [Candidatus Thermoplasmatota archaeon]
MLTTNEWVRVLICIFGPPMVLGLVHVTTNFFQVMTLAEVILLGLVAGIAGSFGIWSKRKSREEVA